MEKKHIYTIRHKKTKKYLGINYGGGIMFTNDWTLSDFYVGTPIEAKGYFKENKEILIDVGEDADNIELVKIITKVVKV